MRRRVVAHRVGTGAGYFERLTLSPLLMWPVDHPADMQHTVAQPLRVGYIEAAGFGWMTPLSPT